MFGQEAYLDESGIHGDADVCIVAGYFGKKGAWRQLESQWRRTLSEFRVPPEEFRAKNLIKREGFFKKWSDEQHREFLHTLARAIAASRIHPVCYGVFVADFFKFSLTERRFLTGATWDDTKKKFRSSGCPNKPYFYVFNECLKTVTSHTPAGSRAHFYFGVDRPVAEYARILFRYLKWRSRIISTDKFGVIEFPLASETPRLQAADLFSYLSYRHMIERGVTGDWTKPPANPLLTLLKNRKNPFDTSYRNHALIKAMIAEIPLPLDVPALDNGRHTHKDN